MRKVLLLVITLVLIYVSCTKVGPGEHAYLAFENNSSDTVYVDSFFPRDTVFPRPNRFWESKEECGIAPGVINYKTLSIYSSGMTYSYEYIFSKTKTHEKVFVYVVPFYPQKGDYPPKPLYDYKLVCYELTFEDLVSLDYHLYYPPNEQMKNIKMDPPYEEVRKRFFTTYDELTILR